MIRSRYDGRDMLLLASVGCILFGLSQWSVALACLVGGAGGLALWAFRYFAPQPQAFPLPTRHPLNNGPL